MNIFENIVGYCDCKQGSRTAGGCAHIVAALFYMIHRKSKLNLPRIHPKAIELGSNLLDCLDYNLSKRQREVEEKQANRTEKKKNICKEILKKNN